MNRPEIVLVHFSSVDGRVTTAPGHNVDEWTALGLDGGANCEAHKLMDELDCDGMLAGSESIMVWGAHPVKHDQPTYWPKKSKGFIVVDGRGRVDWGQTDTLTVITREDVSPAYIEQLKGKNVTYIQAGRGEHVDLGLAMEKLYELGFRRVALTGGGAINGAMLRAGLIDEISLVVAPVAIGGRSTPTLFDAPDLSSVEQATRLELLHGRPVGSGAFWLHYKVIR